MTHTCESMMGAGSRYFNPQRHVLHVDGLLTIKTSGWEDGETHWTGFMTLKPSEPEYEFWYWMACIKQVPGLVEESDIATWKSEYAASLGKAEAVPH